MSLAKLVLPAQIRRNYDVDAAAYIAAVEAADGQSLERGVKDAITEFVVGCKTRGIWNAIKSCCLLCGARTLNGALVPLKGPAPTNFNFINSNYNRETGLKGNGTNQHLGTNFSSSSLDLNNIHFSIYLSSSINSNSGPDGARTYISDFDRNAIRSGTGFGQIRCNNTNLLSYDISSINNFIGCSRNNNSTFTLRLKNNDVSLSSLSSSFSSDQFRIFCRHQGNNIYKEFSDGRISFYSIGESIDLRLLQQVFDIYNDRLFRFFYPSSLHLEASSWISLAEANNRPKISATLANAINVFCNSIDSSNLRSKFYRLNLFCGPSLTTCTIPLYRGTSFGGTKHGNATDQTFNFSNTRDYSELGLQGTIASSTYMETGLLTTTINSLYPNIHFSVYANNTPTAGTFVQVGDGTTGYALVTEFGGPFLNLIGGNHIVNAQLVYGTPSGMTITSRTATNLVRLYRNGSYVTQATADITSPPAASGTGWSNQALRLFASIIQINSPASYSNMRSCGYSVGSSLTQQEATDYYNITQAFQVSLGRQL